MLSTDQAAKFSRIIRSICCRLMAQNRMSQRRHSKRNGKTNSNDLKCVLLHLHDCKKSTKDNVMVSLKLFFFNSPQKSPVTAFYRCFLFKVAPRQPSGLLKFENGRYSHHF